MAVSDQDGDTPFDIEPLDKPLERLAEEPGLFDWRQAARIAEGVAAALGTGYHAPGFDRPPDLESPRFQASPDMNHAYADVGAFVPGVHEPDVLSLSLTDASSRHSLLGAHGVLPAWYSELALERKEKGDSTLLDFLAMFDHRLLSLSYRGWWHHRPELRREKKQAGETLPDMDRWFDAIAGLHTPGLRERLHPSLLWLVRCFAPLFANAARPVAGLAALLSAYAGSTVTISEFEVRWFRLRESDQNRLPDLTKTNGRNCCLGRNLALGERVREAQSNFGIILGPLTWKEFCRFLPTPAGTCMEGLCELSRLYAGADRSFIVKLLVAPGEVRGVCLGGGESGTPHLGWNIWLATNSTESMAADAVFMESELDGGE